MASSPDPSNRVGPARPFEMGDEQNQPAMDVAPTEARENATDCQPTVSTPWPDGGVPRPTRATDNVDPVPAADAGLLARGVELERLQTFGDSFWTAIGKPELAKGIERLLARGVELKRIQSFHDCKSVCISLAVRWFRP